MTDSRVFRPAITDDAPGIADVHATSWRQTYAGALPDAMIAQFNTAFRQRSWNRLLSATPPWVFTCLDSGEVIGFSSVRPLDGSVAELNNLYVLKNAHGKGIGQKLFDMAAEKAKATNFEELCLWVLLDSPATVFYEKMGGRFIANETIRIGDHAVAVSQYRWSI